MELAPVRDPVQPPELRPQCPQRVPRGLARVGVHPAPERRRVHLGPHVVRDIEDPSCVKPDRAAAQGEAVGPLAAPAAARATLARDAFQRYGARRALGE